MRTPVQTRSESSSERMLAATEELLAAGGLAAVTVAAVARRAGASNGALYHRFGDRTGLLLAVEERVLHRVEAATAAAFHAAGAEPDDDAAVLQLARAALAVFADHRAAMRAFLVEARHHPDGDAFTARTVRSAHRLSVLVTEWLQHRFGCSPQDADAAWRVLYSLGAAQALVDDESVSPHPLGADDLARALARAVAAVVRTVP
ncbi:hypothetical protein GCM10027047_14850 [Rhodococcus aerolatus]